LIWFIYDGSELESVLHVGGEGDEFIAVGEVARRIEIEEAAGLFVFDEELVALSEAVLTKGFQCPNLGMRRRIAFALGDARDVGEGELERLSAESSDPGGEVLLVWSEEPDSFFDGFIYHKL